MPVDHDGIRTAPPRKRRVVIDFFPVHANGSNGGIKVMACELVPEIFRQARDVEFVILTGAHNHNSLLHLEAVNARCLCIDDPDFRGWPNFSRPYGIHGGDLHADIQIGFDGFLPDDHDEATIDQIRPSSIPLRGRPVGAAYDRRARHSTPSETAVAGFADTRPHPVDLTRRLDQATDADGGDAHTNSSPCEPFTDRRDNRPALPANSIATGGSPVPSNGESQAFPRARTPRQRLSIAKRQFMGRLPEPLTMALRHSRSAVRHHWTLLPHYGYWTRHYARQTLRNTGRALALPVRESARLAGSLERSSRRTFGSHNAVISRLRGARRQIRVRIQSHKTALAAATEGLRHRWMSIERYERRTARKEIRKHARYHQRFRELEADLLFCPFSAQMFAGLGVPTITVIADLQYRFYPTFFDRGNWLARELQFLRAARNSHRIVAISRWTRQTILEAIPGLPADRVTAIHIGIAQRFTRPDETTIAREVRELELTPNEFLLFPANFWPHKNHANAIAAFAQFVRGQPHSRLKLVLTGEDTGRGADVKEMVDAAGLAEHVVFTGYCGNRTLAALMASCRALYFPSLFEGFGIPPVEAMAMGRPVLCSNVASLPEIVEDAAVTFDPADPDAICQAIRQLDNGEIDLEALRRRGYRRVAAIGDAPLMARRYLTVIRETLDEFTPAAERPQSTAPKLGSRQAA